VSFIAIVLGHTFEKNFKLAKNPKVQASSPCKKIRKSIPASDNLVEEMREEIDDLLLPGSPTQTPKSPPMTTLSQKSSIVTLQ
jgi:hypothetical protein